MAAADERVEEVDPDGRVQRVVTRAEMRAGRLRHRTVFVAVVDTAGERIVVHRRADWKDVWPGSWDLAFGGVVGVGEDWADAAGRELAEEAGITAPIQPIGGGTYDDDAVSELARVFLAHHDGPFRFADGEVVETTWVPLAGLADWVGSRPVVPDSVALVLPRLPGCAP